jgi:hypothetical protein
MSKKITFRIGKDGNASIENVEGFGTSCMDATRFLEHALGNVDESSRKMTDEYNKPSEVSEEYHIRH